MNPPSLFDVYMLLLFVIAFVFCFAMFVLSVRAGKREERAARK
jgi:hypothetical protein